LRTRFRKLDADSATLLQMTAFVAVSESRAPVIAPVRTNDGIAVRLSRSSASE
jgi:hypothetical protein